MYKLKRFYDQNRKGIWMAIIIIASLFILLQVVNHFEKINNEKELNNNTNGDENANSNNINTNVNLKSSTSAITGENVSKENLDSATKTIERFINFCNEKKIEEAYNMLTEDCKREMYTSVNMIEQAYYNDVFNGEEKSCNIENWTGNIYKVNIVEDMLSTGKSNNGYTKQDYMTVKKEDNGYKLNINNYIGYSKIDKTTKKDNIEINVMSKNTYMDNERYTIKVTNNSKDEISLDGLSDVKSLYLQDSKGAKYSAYTHELTEPTLKMEPGQTKEITIKFYSNYVSSKNINYIVFSDMIIYSGQGSEKKEFKVNT